MTAAPGAPDTATGGAMWCLASSGCFIRNLARMPDTMAASCAQALPSSIASRSKERPLRRMVAGGEHRAEGGERERRGQCGAVQVSLR